MADKFCVSRCRERNAARFADRALPVTHFAAIALVYKDDIAMQRQQQVSTTLRSARRTSHVTRHRRPLRVQGWARGLDAPLPAQGSRTELSERCVFASCAFSAIVTAPTIYRPAPPTTSMFAQSIFMHHENELSDDDARLLPQLCASQSAGPCCVSECSPPCSSSNRDQKSALNGCERKCCT